MIPVEYYKTAYFACLAFILIVFLLPVLLRKPIEYPIQFQNNIIVILLIILSVLFIGLRDPHGDWRFLGDTSSYTRTFESIQNGQRTEFTKDIGFYLFMKLFTLFTSVKVFYIVCAFLYTYLPYLSFKKQFGPLAIYVFIAYLVSLSFLPFGINGLRNGLAVAIFLSAFIYFKKKWIFYFIIILSISFHKAMLLPFVAFLISSFVLKDNKKALYFWLLTIPISLLFRDILENFAELIFSSDTVIQDDRASTYFSEEGQKYDVSGQFRWDFIIYSGVAVFVGYWAILKKKLSNPLYTLIFRTYIIANGMWILLIYAPYTNRVAYLSWFLMPIVLTVPFISDIRESILNNKKKLIYVIYGSLLFTIFMELI